MKKIYTLPNGDEIDISKIKRIGTLKSVRLQSLMSLGYWHFTIYYENGTSKKIRENYFYSDWGEKKSKLQMIKDDILKSIS